MLRTRRLPASLAIVPLVLGLSGCAVSAGAIGLKEPALVTSVGVRSSPQHAASGLGWRVAVDRIDLPGDDGWGASADVLVPFFQPTYLLLGASVTNDMPSWSVNFGIGADLDVRQANYYWGIFADGGFALAAYDDDDARDQPGLTYFARAGLYFCFRPLPC